MQILDEDNKLIRGENINILKISNQIEEILYECGEILKNVDYENLNIESKQGNNNIVTKYDIDIQNYLKKKLLEIVPNAEFIGEENSKYVVKNNKYTFIVDPIDGTTNFSRRLNMSAISVALLENNEPILGVCYVPYVHEMYKGIKGQGAYLNEKRIFVSNRKLSEGIVLCGCAPYYDDLREKSLNIQKKFASIASDYRRFGSAVIELCSIASGKAEIYFELKLMPWDYAAASLIIKEAGGVVTTMDEKELQYKEPTTIIASNGVEKYLKYLE